MALKNIRFYIKRLDKYTSQRVKIDSYPAFVLHEDNWDDYAVCCLFNMYYHPDNSTSIEIGRVKIIAKDEVPSDDWGKPTRTADFLPNPFADLADVGGCSLGQDEAYYKRLKKTFSNESDIFQVLHAIRDCAVYSDVYDEMCDNPCFKCMVRFDEAEQQLRLGELIIRGLDTENSHRFEYSFQVPYNNDETLKIRFDFKEQEDIIPRRLYAIIGENGAGKTYLLNQLPCDYIALKKEQFNNILPRYSKVIKVSTSFYDDYPEPPVSDFSKFVYCGFRNHEEDREKRLQDILQDRILKALEKIKKDKIRRDGEDKLYSILKNFLPISYLDAVYDEFEGFELKKIPAIVDRMSSGECNMFFIICDILANIRLDTLILFDEPEVHMHPNAITIFMNIVYSILDKYKSYAIISTHSPLVVREIFGDNVYVMERHEDVPVIRKIGMESFAANLTDLYNEIFSNKDTNHYYEKVLRRLKREGCSYDDVMELLHSDALDPNLNMRLMIMNMFQSRDEED